MNKDQLFKEIQSHMPRFEDVWYKRTEDIMEVYIADTKEFFVDKGGYAEWYNSGERLVKTSAMNKTVSKDTVNTVLKYDMPIESKDGVDCIKVFVWDTVNNMKPYCKSAVFK